MSKSVERNYLEISSLNQLNASKKKFQDFLIELLEPDNFQLNKFFYKNIGKNHHWVDRLVWSDQQWINYVSDKKVKTYILKNNNDLAGFFEIILPNSLRIDVLLFTLRLSRFLLSKL